MSYGGRGPPPDVEGMISLKVDNLTYRTTPDDLRRAFSKYGDIGDIYIPRDRFTRDSRGFAFIRYYDRRDAEDAIDSMDGRVMDGRELRVQMARYGRPDDRDRYRDRRPPRRSPRRRYSRSRSKSRSRSRSQDRRRHRSRSNSRSPRRERTPASSRSRSPTPKSKSPTPT